MALGDKMRHLAESALWDYEAAGGNERNG
jgi:hypothetical protein